MYLFGAYDQTRCNPRQLWDAPICHEATRPDLLPHLLIFYS